MWYTGFESLSTRRSFLKAKFTFEVADPEFTTGGWGQQSNILPVFPKDSKSLRKNLLVVMGTQSTLKELKTIWTFAMVSQISQQYMRLRRPTSCWKICNPYSQE